MTPNVLIVEARFYPHISDALLDGATAALEKGGARFDRIAVPGALEIPPAIAFAAKAGEGAGKSFDGFVALGCVIRGETYHFEIVAGEVRARADGARHPSRAVHRQRHPDRRERGAGARARRARRHSTRAAMRRAPACR